MYKTTCAGCTDVIDLAIKVSKSYNEQLNAWYEVFDKTFKHIQYCNSIHVPSLPVHMFPYSTSRYLSNQITAVMAHSHILGQQACG